MLLTKACLFTIRRAVRLLPLLLLVSQVSNAQTHWLKSWYAVPTDAGGPTLIANTTFRQTITPNASGNMIRLRFSNTLGSDNLTIKNVTINQQSNMAQAYAGTSKQLSFNGSNIAVIPKGGYITSDPIGYDVAAFKRYHVSFTPLTTTNKATRHFLTYEAPYFSFITPPNGEVNVPFIPIVIPDQQSWVLLESMDILSSSDKQIVLAIGDSITDGAGSDIDRILQNPAFNSNLINTRYTDFLARRLQQANNTKLVVLNAGISGNRVGVSLPSFAGPSLLDRLQRDVLSVPNVKTVILLEGINDLFNDKQRGAAERLIANLTSVIKRLKAQNINVVLGTLTPPTGLPPILYWLGGFQDINVVEKNRQKVNAWIRSQQLSSSVVDFDLCLRNPLKPAQYLPAYHSGDFLHPNAKGYKAMANCINLNQL